jgi:hypothetical protein
MHVPVSTLATGMYTVSVQYAASQDTRRFDVDALQIKIEQASFQLWIGSSLFLMFLTKPCQPLANSCFVLIFTTVGRRLRAPFSKAIRFAVELGT